MPSPASAASWACSKRNVRPALRRLFLRALSTDSEAQLRDGEWETRCLHCRRRLYLRADGEALGHATLEHVVPQAWFGKRAADPLVSQVDNNANDPRNLATSLSPAPHAITAKVCATMRADRQMSALKPSSHSCWHTGSRAGASR